MEIFIKSFDELKGILPKLNNKKQVHINISIGKLIFQIRFHEGDFEYFIKYRLYKNKKALAETNASMFCILEKVKNKWEWNGFNNSRNFIINESKNQYKILYNYCIKQNMFKLNK